MTEAIFQITLLRHGESVGNRQGLLQGQADYPLSDTGRRQVHALAERWQGEGRRFDRIIASPLSRARETAEILTGVLQLPLEFDPVWMERNYGSWSGRGIDDYTAAITTQPSSPHEKPGETGESNFELHLRAGRALLTLMERVPGAYLVVSHGGLLNMFLYQILGIQPQAGYTGPRFNFRNCGFATLEYTPDQHRWRVHGIDDRSHWLPASATGDFPQALQEGAD
jgi:broad specificity phosphatase PhoE